MARVLILGGGFGGLAAAHRLRGRLAPEDEILVVDRRSYFMVGFRKSWALVGLATLEEGQRPLAALQKYGIRFIQGTVDRLNPEERGATVAGRRIEADALVVALGAEPAPALVPGFERHAFNVYDPAEIPRARRALDETAGGKVMIGIFASQFKCPPAPYEIALLVREYLQESRLSAEVEVFTPLPMSLPVLGRAGCDVIESRLAERGIAFLPDHQAVAVEEGAVVFQAGRRPFGLLLGIPPHRAPEVVAQSGLAAEGGWVQVDPYTLETGYPGVYAIGDVVQIKMADGKPLPKAGVFAEAQGAVVAERIAAVLAGESPRARFSGEGGCYLEVGAGEAMLVQGRFLAEPQPEVALSAASPDLLEEKRAFERERWQRWLA